MDYKQLNENALIITREPLAGASVTNLLRLLTQNRFRIDVRYMPRMLYTMTISSLMTLSRIKEYAQFEKAIQKTEITQSPLFILGHWRSGTTYLHNLLSLDSTFGYFSTFHASLPSVFLGNEAYIKSIVASSLPEKRPMDDVAMGLELPQEDEFALAAVTPYSANHGLCFPRNATYYNRFIFMDDVPQKIKDEWKDVYLHLIKKETLYRDGKRLVLKNPANTARIKLLLELFPEAKFIHIYRNPYYVYQSMMKLLLNLIPLMCVQKPPEITVVEQQVLQVYKRMYMKYLTERTDIPKENLIEVRYEDFIQQPLTQVKNIYSTLHLNGFKQSEKKFTEYILSQTQVKKQKYVLDENVKEKIYREWTFAFDAFQYEK
jgi:omega-hydroxy-beta-dihydromenaquinone-9 sulfotransferase